MTVLSATIISGILVTYDGNAEHALPLILSVFILAGLFQILLGALKLGSYIQYIPQTVVSGFMSGIGIIILITQLLPAIGYNPVNDPEVIQENMPIAEHILLDKILSVEEKDGLLVLEDFHETVHQAGLVTPQAIQDEAKGLAGSQSKGVIGSLKFVPHAIKNIHPTEITLCLITILIIYLFPRITRLVPSALVAVIGVSAGAVMMGIEYAPITPIQAGFPSFHSEIITEFDITSVFPYVLTAFILSLLGVIDSLLTSLVADNLTKTQHDPNRELIGQGIGNTISAFFSGIPGAGATIRTVVNIQAGGRTRLSGMIAGVLLFVILIALGPMASKIPMAVLSGVLITVGFGVIDYKGLKELLGMRWSDKTVLLTVLLLTVFWQLVYAVVIGLIFAAFIFMKKIADWSADKFTLETFVDLNGHTVALNTVQGPLFFGNTQAFAKVIRTIPTDSKYIIFDLSQLFYLDHSGIYTLEESLEHLIDSHEVYIVGLSAPLQRRLEKMKIIPQVIQPDHVLENFEQLGIEQRTPISKST
jgi:SulP family sulfate permease